MMDSFSRYPWTARLWRFKVLLFLSLFLVNVNCKAASEGIPSMASATIAAASFSPRNGTISLVIITLCSNHHVVEAAPNSLHRTVCWRSSEVKTWTENSSFTLAREKVLCGIFLCWDCSKRPTSLDRTRVKLASGAHSHGISLSAMATGSSFNCGLVEGNFSVLFCWGDQFGNGEFLAASRFIPDFGSRPAAEDGEGSSSPWPVPSLYPTSLSVTVPTSPAIGAATGKRYISFPKKMQTVIFSLLMVIVVIICIVSSFCDFCKIHHFLRSEPEFEENVLSESSWSVHHGAADVLSDNNFQSRSHRGESALTEKNLRLHRESSSEPAWMLAYQRLHSYLSSTQQQLLPQEGQGQEEGLLQGEEEAEGEAFHESEAGTGGSAAATAEA